MVVTLCFAETSVGAFLGTPQPASGQIEAATPEAIGENYDASAYDASGYAVAPRTPLRNLQTQVDDLAEAHLLPKFRKIDPNLEAGYTGSFRTGTVGNPTKSTFGQPIDLNKFDVDYWIKSDVLFKKYGNSLKADVDFRKILSETPGFEGLKPNKQGFSIKFLPSSQ